jgi:hypothetical protein
MGISPQAIQSLFKEPQHLTQITQAGFSRSTPDTSSTTEWADSPYSV